jgi:hypothetical protein
MFAVLVFTVSAALAQETKQRTIIVTGQSEMEIKPDTARLTFEASSTKPDVLAAKSEVDAVFRKLIGVLKQVGVAEEDISAARLRIRADYDYQRSKRVLKGYEVTRFAHISLRDLDKLDMVLQKSLEAGAIQMSKFELLSSEEDRLRDEAFRLASAAARRKATLMAKEAGATIGKVLRIRQSGYPYGVDELMEEFGPYAGYAMGGYGMGGPPPKTVPAEEAPYLPGKIKITAGVVVEFELEDAK